MRSLTAGQRAARLTLAVLPVVAALKCSHWSHAATQYWDVNGSAAGAGGPTPSGTWNSANTLWNSNSNGTSATSAWVSGNDAMFSAGTDATGAYTVTVSGTQTVNDLHVADGNVTLTGGSLVLTTDAFNFPTGIGASPGRTLNVVTPLSGTDGMFVDGYLRLMNNAANPLTGITRVQSGATLLLDSPVTDGAFPSGELDVQNGGLAQLQKTNQIGNTVQVNVEGSGLFDMNGFSDTIDFVVLGGGTLDPGGGTCTLVHGILSTGGPSTGTIGGSGTLRLTSASHTFDITDDATNPIDAQVTIPIIENVVSSSIVKSGDGTLLFTTANSFTGSTTINGGALRIQSATALGTGSSAVVINAGELYVDNISLARNLTLNSGATLRGSGASAATTGVATVTAGATISLETGTSATDRLTIGNASNDFTGGSAATQVNVRGSGKVVLPQASNFQGSWSVFSGTLRVENASSLGTSTTDVQLSGGALEIGGITYARDVDLNNGGTLRGTGAASFTGQPTVASGAAVTLASGTSSSDVLTMASIVGSELIGGGSGATITVSGSGKVIISRAGTYAGNWIVSSSTLEVSNLSLLGSDSNAVTLSGGTISTTSSSNSATSRVITNTGSGGTWSVGLGATVTFFGTVTGSAAFSKGGHGMLVLDGTNSFSGDLNVNFGELRARSGHDISVATLDIGASSIATDTTALLTIDGSTTNLNVAGLTQLGRSGKTGTLTLQNSATATFGTDLHLAQSGNTASEGDVNILSGSSATVSGSISIGASGLASQVGTMLISGASGSVHSSLRLNGSGTLVIGNSSGLSAGDMTLSSGGIYRGGSGLTTVSKNGLIDIQDTASWGTDGDVLVDGGTIQRSTSGGLDLFQPGRSMTIQNAGSVIVDGTYSLSYPITVTGSAGGLPSLLQQRTSSSISVHSNVNITAGGKGDFFGLTIGSQNDGSLTVDGINSLLAVSGTTSIAALGGTGSLILQNSAQASLGTVLTNVTVSDAATTSQFTVQSNADVTAAGNITFDSSGLGQSNTLITGSGSTFTLLGASTLTVGATSGAGSATLTVASSGLFSIGTGVATINNNGLVDITGGTFSAAGNVTISGGTLRTTGGTFGWVSSKVMNVQSGGQAIFNAGFALPTSAVVNVLGAGSALNTPASSLTIQNGSTLNLSNGGSCAVGATLNLGSSSAGGIISVDGGGVGGSSLSISSSTSMGTNGGNGQMTFFSNALGSFASITMTNSVSAASQSHITVQSGSDVTASGDIIVGQGIASGQTSTILVTGSGSTFQQTGSSALTIGAASGSTASLTVSTNASFTSGSGIVTINPTGTLALDNSGLFTANALVNVKTGGAITIASGGRLDLTDKKMILQAGAIGAWNGTDYTGTTKLIKDGRNNGGWNGTGIVTAKTAAASPGFLTNLAIATAGDVGKTTFGSVSVAANDVLVMYTYNGDANLSGKIDADDYFQIDSHYNKSANSSKSWFNGDFNYDGKINGDDYFAIDNAFAGQGAPFSTADLPSGVSVVPEPGSLTTLLPALLLRRRRKIS